MSNCKGIMADQVMLKGGDDGEAGYPLKESNNLTNSGHENGEVKVKRPQKGYLFTRNQLILFVGCVLAIIILVALLAGLIGRTRPNCPTADSELTENDPLVLNPTALPTIDPSLPWAKIRLPRKIIPLFYTLVIRVDLSSFIFNGSVTINVTCEEDTNLIILHTYKLNIDDTATVVRDSNNADLDIARTIRVPKNQFYVIELKEQLKTGASYKVIIGKYNGTLEDDLRGLYRSSYKNDNGTLRYLAASQLQSADARKVFPCFDEPDLKANFAVSIEHLKEYTALSNMPTHNIQRLGGGWLRANFLQSPVMSTYLLAFVISDFTSRQRISANGLKVRIWANKKSYKQTEYALDFAVKSYDYFGDYFDIEEVVPKSDHVAIPDFSAGAMENWGLVLYRETALLLDDDVSSILTKYWVSMVMAHEVSHSWFGNMVTMKWWDDLWLNEGFASTLMYFAMDDIYKSWNVFDMQIVTDLFPVMTKDSLLTSHPISTPIHAPEEIAQSFDSISYDKGMSVLRMLRGFLGWDDFRRGLQEYIKVYKFKNAEMQDLWATFTRVVDDRYDVGKIMDTWTRQMGFPVVTVHKEGDIYTITQDRMLLNPGDQNYDKSSSKYGYQWLIPFTYITQDEPTREKTVWLEEKTGTIQHTAGKWILGNAEYMGFYRTNYDLDIWKLIIKQLKTDHLVFSTANRAGLISDAFNLARASKLDYSVPLELATYLKVEEEYVPWKAFFDEISFLKGMLDTSSSYGLLQKFIHDLVEPHYNRLGVLQEGELPKRYLRRLLLEQACEIEITHAVEYAKNQFKIWMETGQKPQSDYALVIYSVGIREGGQLEWDHLWKKSQETIVASERETMMDALSYSQKVWLLWRYANWTFDNSKIRMQDIRLIFKYFGATPLGRSVSRQFMITNWKFINDRFGQDNFLIRDIISSTTSLIHTQYEQEQLENLYRKNPPSGFASKAADDSLAQVRANVQWTVTQEGQVSSWMKNYARERSYFI